MINLTNQFAAHLGIKIVERNKGRSLCALAIKRELYNPLDVIHGGALYTLADSGMGVALYPSLDNDEFCATIEIKISYFKPVREGEIICKSWVINRGKRIAYLESEIFVDDALVAKANGSYSIFKPNEGQKE